jgi:uncharacterized protein (DUF885 family)
MRLFLFVLASSIVAAFAQGNEPCIFCQIVRGEREVSTVYRDAKVMAFLDHAPLNPGHTLIIPIEHRETLLELPAEVAGQMMAVAQKIAEGVTRTDLKAESFQLQMNNGPMVQRTKHAALHVWPRFRGDFSGPAGARFEGDRARIPRPELDATAAKIRQGLKLSELYEDYYRSRLKLFPLEATSAGEPGYNDQFPNTLSEEYRNELRKFNETFLARLKEIEQSTLPISERVNYETLQWECEISLAELDFRTDLLPVNQFHSLPLCVAVLAGGTSAQPFKTMVDYENWLKRVDGFIAWSERAIEKMRLGIAQGYVLPKALTEKVIPQFLKMATGPASAHVFYGPIKDMPADFSDADRARLTRAYEEMISHKIIPAYAALHAFVLAEYLPASRGSSGIDGIPRGKEFYALQVRNYTTTDLSADEIHELGKKEVERIHGEMEKVKEKAKFQGSLREFFASVRNKKELMPFSDAQQVIDHFNAIHEKMRPSLERLFTVVPKTPFQVRRTESFREKSAAAQYMAGSLDGTRPGTFSVPIPDVAEYSVVGTEALFLHEAIPGHHYQISLQRENTGLPRFRRTLGYSAFSEGWALYCESLGKELGLYEDPYQYFGMLSGEIHRAIRLVVDTGIHAKGWTREQAIAYSLENEPRSEGSIIAEVERYMAIPGQALSYKVGELKIKELRTRAEKDLGEKFKLREFHQQVLATGSVPLRVLEEKINRWIAESKQD